MSTNQTTVMTSHNLLNYSGMLFNKGDTRTPFLTLIGGKSRQVQHWEFPVSLAFQTGGGTTQPAITETASLTAPTAEFITRTQSTNYCQIFQKALSISYGKLSSMGQLSGLNIAGAEANPADELDFQVANAMAAIRNDLDFVFLNGAKQNGNYDDVAYKTQGITAAISTNATALEGTPALNYWAVAELIEDIANSNAPVDDLVLLARPVNIMQLNADAAANGLTVVQAGREINGIALTTLETPFGRISLLPAARVASGTALIVNPAVCAPVYMDVPGKGNFFLEPLAKTGAADNYQIYGQAGLDFGAEWYHGKLTGLATTFTAPTYSKKVYVAGGTIETTTPAAAEAGSGGTNGGTTG